MHKGFPLLTHAGVISHAQMESNTSALYLHYDQSRKASEAQAADQQDDQQVEATLIALEQKLKHRPHS